MTRRSPRPRPIAADATLPAGWIRHDGASCPVAPESRPGVMFRNGSRHQAGARRADSWSDMWRHTGASMDIVAWRPELGDAPPE